MPKKGTTCKTKGQFILEAQAIHGTTYTYDLVEYLGVDVKVEIVCKVHGAFKQAPYYHLKGQGCCKCSGRYKMSTQDFIERAVVTHGDKYDYSKAIYKNRKTKLTIICPVHGEFYQTPETHFISGCAKCAGVSKLATSEFIKKARYIHGDRYSYDVVDYKNSHSHINVTCKDHGVFSITPNNLLNGHGCKLCNGGSRLTTKEFIEKAKQKHGELYDYSLVDYINTESDVNILCKDHGVFNQSPLNHLAGKGCRFCTSHVSSHEILISEWFNGIPHKRGDRSVLGGKELDLYFQSNKLAVEINGVYWHTESKGRGERYHVTKSDLCLQNGIQLLHFWDIEVEEKPLIVKSIISQKLKLNASLYARSTKVVDVDFETSKQFLNNNHLQGNAPSYSVSYGLEHKGELIAIMTFGKPRFSKEAEWEMLRFACKINTSVVGGASKLYSKFIKTHNPNSVISYADKRYSEGYLYSKLGFEFIRDSTPNYFYVNGSRKTISRYSAQKHKLEKLLGDKFDPAISETENMLANGFHKVYDCGNKVYLWRQ